MPDGLKLAIPKIQKLLEVPSPQCMPAHCMASACRTSAKASVVRTPFPRYLYPSEDNLWATCRCSAYL